MHHPTDMITHTTAFVTQVVEHWVERDIAQWVHPMKDRSDDPPSWIHLPLIGHLFIRIDIFFGNMSIILQVKAFLILL